MAEDSGLNQLTEDANDTGPPAVMDEAVACNEGDFHDDFGEYHDDDHDAYENSDLGDSEGSDMELEVSEELHRALHEIVKRNCSVCLNFLQGRLELYTKRWERFSIQETQSLLYHPSLLSLRESVQAGCCLCKELAKSLDNFYNMRHDVPKDHDGFRTIKCSVRGERWLSHLSFEGFILRFTLHDGDDQRLSEHFLTEMSFSPAGALGLGPEFYNPAIPATTPKSPLSIEMARQWYRDCLNHNSCRSWQAESRILPTRLIRIFRRTESSADLVAQLCETRDIQESPLQYVTLSHCWGKRTMFKLLEENIDVLKQEIPMGRLSTLFRDAFYITDQLGLAYIWIDSLCIVQNSENDWANESKQMGDNYRGAEFNIAATGYEDTQFGVFTERDALPLLNFPVHARYVLSGHSEETGKVETKFEGIYIRFEASEFAVAMSQGHLNSRGWVAQERGLSSGIIHFTPKQMWWECKCRIANEAFPSIRLHWEDEHGGAAATRALDTMPGSSMNREDIYAAWNDFIGFYAGTQLTIEEDRFPAAHGIAVIFGALLNDNLVAGIWEGDLIRSLVWRADKAKRIQSLDLAPSWSWASLSLSHETGYYNIKFTRPFRGIQVQVLSSTENFVSDLQSTLYKKSAVRGLAVRGPLRRLTVGVTKLPAWQNFIKRRRTFLDVEELGFYSGQHIPDHQKWRWSHPTHLLPLTREFWSSFPSDFRIEALILQQVPGAGNPNTFRRLGTVSFTFLTGKLADGFFGLMKEDGNFERSVAFRENGFEDIVLI